MKVFVCAKNGLTAVAVAFNRGHAVKMLAKELEEARGSSLTKDDPLTEVEARGTVTVIPHHNGVK